MKYSKVVYIILSIGSILIFSACVGSPKVGKNDFVYKGYNFGANRGIDYQQGIKDGCRTSSGDYTKNHKRFNNNQNYHMGWGNGRLHCK